MSKNSATLIGIDTGGTFSDFVYIRNGEIHVLKILSTPKNPGEAILTGLKKILSNNEFDYSIIHGSTVATNALLERKGARTALITTKGFKDILEIGRQNRAEIYNIFVDRPQPLIPSSRRFEIDERTCHDGSILKEIQPDECDELLKKLGSKKISSLAVCFLHSYANANNEKSFARKARSKKFSVSLSSEILPEYREFERMSTTVVNAYVAPIMDAYLNSLQKSQQNISLRIMKSNGGIISANTAGRESVNTILSGPAGGVVGAFAAGKQAGYKNIITFDMGGTSTDVALCPGLIPMTSESNVAGCPIKVPMIDIHTVGAGGGSIASMDVGGALKVGPESAGADPGPAAYGRGSELTVTDANLFLNRLDPGHFLNGEMKIDSSRLNSVMTGRSKKFKMDPVILAAGIVKVVNSNMEKALRVISIERGFNPADFAIVSFGGAGALHAAELAKPLNIRTIIIPKNPGIYSAIGMLYSDFVKDYSRTVLMRIGGDGSARRHPSSGKTGSSIFSILEKRFKPLEKTAHQEMLNEGIPKDKIVIQKFVDVRYKGQAYELTVPYAGNFLTAFHKAHEQFYGFCDEKRETEAVTIRIKCTGKTTHPAVKRKNPGINRSLPSPKVLSKSSGQANKRKVFGSNSFENASIYIRDNLQPGNKIKGPAVIHEYSSTTYVPKGFYVQVDKFENLIMTY